MSFAPSLARTSAVHRARTGRIALWAVQLALAGMFLLAGSSKLLGAAAMVGLFDAIGIGQWLRYVTGIVEVASAIALLVPSFAVFGAVTLVATMVGAVATHLFIVGGSPAMPSILLLGSAAVVWARRHQLLDDLGTVAMTAWGADHIISTNRSSNRLQGDAMSTKENI